MADSMCRWGILSTAGIAHKNWHAIANASNAELVAVASRQADRAQQFIDACQADVPMESAPIAVEGYEPLLERPDIDAVYIPLPTGVRKDWVVRAAERGKHVLAEKPAGVNAADVADMISTCRDNNVQFMDGVMFMHSRRLDEIRAVLDSGEPIGDIRRIASHHAFAGDQEFLDTNIRLNSELEPQGALGDLGWYSIRFILWVLKGRMPTTVAGRTLRAMRRSDSPAEVPLEFSGEMLFDDVSASLYASFITENQQWVNIGGSKGFLTVDDFVLPFFGNEIAFQTHQAVYAMDGCHFNMERHSRVHAVSEYANNRKDAQETRMIEKFSELVLAGDVDPSWGEWAWKTQKVMDALLESARIERPVEIDE